MIDNIANEETLSAVVSMTRVYARSAATVSCGRGHGMAVMESNGLMRSGEAWRGTDGLGGAAT